MKSENEEGTAFDVVWLKPENERPSKSSTLPMLSVVVVFFSAVSSMVSKEFSPSILVFVFSVGGPTTASAVLLSFRVRIFGGIAMCGVGGRATSVGLFSGVFDCKEI